ncbi:transcriptional regulator [Sphaerochaeta pleomorpha str. Grapes]|uniref:Transcriptional regulator n=1 Tax=Sphaerochaeta pleomorpha (strain ATCC BAA-1885 / DSM 22778 / Grapes) TaxID=158190 RepID=G8QSC3_SPHPG|nr:LacI family DNA-binding transcriptional regulator [Sphaerochaeta pleomorpha]AEV30053.1 transcriptional regulator [Sphaerochaeta pleomorpha str. Grapes]
MATIKDISKLSGVSPSAVSRILNHDSSLSVSNETKIKVLAAAEELEYVTIKERKRNSVKEKRLTIAIVEWYSESALIEDPYYLYLEKMVEKKLAQEDIDTFKIVNIDGTYTSAVNAQVDGLIAIGRFSPSQVTQLTSFSPYIVFLDSSPDPSLYDSLLINTEQGITLAMKHLFELGHTKIGFVCGHVIDDNGGEGFDLRKKAYYAFMKENNLFSPSLIFEGDRLSYEQGRILTKRILDEKERPTALVVANDTMATGVLSLLQESGLSVPSDMSLVGFNDLPSVKFLDPPLTSVQIPMQLLAMTAVDLLRQRITGDYPVPLKIFLPTMLKVRKSTAIPHK